jgi:hypothetical protein
MAVTRRWWRALSVSALAVAAAGCDLLGIGGPEGELHDQRAAWEALGIHDYSVTMQPQCYCPPEAIRTAVVQVRADTVLDVQDPATGEPPAFRQLYRTVEGLFDLIQDAFDRNAESVDVTYDEILHFPTNIAIDYDTNAYDEEIYYTVWGLATQRD